VNKITSRILRKARKIYTRRYPDRHAVDLPEVDFKKQEANDQIRALLAANQPCMVSRLGGGETPALLSYLEIISQEPFLKKSTEYIQGKRAPFWWDAKVKSDISNLCGFFPPTEDMLTRYSIFVLDQLKQIDILGSWLKAEHQLKDYFSPHLIRIPLDDLEPYFFDRPWSEMLAGKKVVVVHPFEESIQRQYARRESLFKDPRVLPAFELKTVKAVQTLVGNKVEFSDWFAALDSMCEKIDRIDFDIAIIGAGAYGLPLAAHVKKLGKQAVHLGGATQLLFGIQGKRWEGKDFSAWAQLPNEHWVRPLPNEVPANFHKVERGCYW
jgi:hypothetical protein